MVDILFFIFLIVGIISGAAECTLMMVYSCSNRQPNFKLLSWLLYIFLISMSMMFLFFVLLGVTKK